MSKQKVGPRSTMKWRVHGVQLLAKSCRKNVVVSFLWEHRSALVAVDDVSLFSQQLVAVIEPVVTGNLLHSWGREMTTCSRKNWNLRNFLSLINRASCVTRRDRRRTSSSKRWIEEYRASIVLSMWHLPLLSSPTRWLKIGLQRAFQVPSQTLRSVPFRATHTSEDVEALRFWSRQIPGVVFVFFCAFTDHLKQIQYWVRWGLPPPPNYCNYLCIIVDSIWRALDFIFVSSVEVTNVNNLREIPYKQQKNAVVLRAYRRPITK